MSKKRIVWATLVVLTAAGSAPAAEVVQYGNTPAHNMVSEEKGVPAKWDPKTGHNIKWSVELGSQSYAGPVVAGGKVFVGTNNEKQYNPALEGDRGNVMAFDEETGKLLWQSAHPKLPAGRVNDWPLQGVCSTPAIEGDRLWYVSNRAELICADTEGFLDDENDGPFDEEGEMRPGPDGQPKLLAKTSKLDEDIVWKLDMIDELDLFPHNLAAGSPLIVGDRLFLVTGNGVDEGHINVPSPFAPNFLAVDKNTGEVLWENALPGENILHGSWSNPSYGVIEGKAQVMFPGGDGWLYSFEPDTGKLIWKFNLNPPGSKWILGGRGTKNNVISMPVVWDDKIYIGVGQDPEHGEGHGNLWAIAPGGKTGDITQSAVAWHRGGEDFHRTMSTAAIADGLMYISDLTGYLYCLDPQTGELHWKYDAFAAIWGSPFVVDGKVYLGDEDGDIAVFKAGKKMELLHEVNMGAAVYTTPFVSDGVLYIVSRNRLFAIQEGIPPKAEPAPKPAAGKAEARAKS